MARPRIKLNKKPSVPETHAEPEQVEQETPKTEVRVSFSIPVAMHDRIRKVSYERRLSHNQLFRTALDRMLRDFEGRDWREAPPVDQSTQ